MIKVTRRQCINFANAVEELKILGNFDFRCAIGAVFLEAKTQLERYGEKQKPTKGYDVYTEEVRVHFENCTSEVNGKKETNTAKYIPLLKKSMMTHAVALESFTQMQEDANRSLEDEVTLQAAPIPWELVEKVDQSERINASLLSKLLPFMGR